MKIRVFLILSVLSFTSSAFAQKMQDDMASSLKVIPQEVQLLKMADNLVAYGRQTKSALPLIQAVQIFRSLNVADAADDAIQTSPFAEAQILSDATKFADGNKTLLALVKEAGKSTRAGVFEEPLRYFRVVESGETISQPLHVDGSHYIQVLVDGQGEGVFSQDKDGNKVYSDLRLNVYDNKGRVIASDQSGGKNCVAAFISRTNNMTIAIKNVGKLSDNCIIYVQKTRMNY